MNENNNVNLPQYKLEFVDYTYAECCGNVIRIHKDLPMYSTELYNHALKHEISHLGKTISQDIMIDLKDLFNFNIHAKALKFYLKHPELIKRMILPIHFNKISRTLEVNWVLILTYFIYLSFILIVFYFFI